MTEKNAPLQKVLDDLHEKSGFTYIGEGDWPQMSRPVSLSVRGVPLQEVLDICFKDQPLSYELNVANKFITVRVRSKQDRAVHGRIVDENREPMARVTIHVSGEGDAASREDGQFDLSVHYSGARLQVSMVGYEPQEVALPEPGKPLTIQMKLRAGTLAEAVVVHTGYQDQRKFSTTGSFEVVDNDLLNRRIAPNILDHIDGVVSGVLFNKNITPGVNQASISIRGRSTIFGNPNPLIVVDNFPYTGDINNINPTDVESITVLKDASAAAIWGTLAGNGVVVITTKKGRSWGEPRLSFTTSQTWSQRANLYYLPKLSSSDYIDIEQYLYNQGYYNAFLASTQYPPLSPVVELLSYGKPGVPPAPAIQAQIDGLRKVDARSDLNKYFYRHELNSQYVLSASGGSDKDQYYLSAGYDRDLPNQVRNEFDRVTLLGNNSYTLLPKQLELTTGLAFTASTTYFNNPGGSGVSYPYAQLADAQGNALPVAYSLRLPYVDTVGGGKLLDWHYRPLDELRNADNTIHLHEYRINLGLRFSILKGLEARAYYQYARNDSDIVQYNSLKTYQARGLINSYTQDSAGVLSFPVPRGGTLNESQNTFTTNDVRLLLNYTNDSLFRRGRINLMAGVEVRDREGTSQTTILYGYDPDLGTSRPVDYLHSYPNYVTGQPQQLTYANVRTGTAERYVSYYANGNYLYCGRYMLSASARRDESNLFGVNANQRGVPLWSAGLAWEASREDFYKAKWLPYLRLRLTDGYNGNVDRDVSAYTTAFASGSLNPYFNPFAGIVNPPNPALRWERVHIINMGLDFGLKGSRLTGSIEYYLKSGQDLIGFSPVDPTTGVATFEGNTADMSNHGLDLTLRAEQPIGAVRWNSVLLFSFVRDKLTRYLAKPGAVQDYFNTQTINPLVGRPLYSIYALRWAGLSPASGDPQGWFQGKVSTDYAGMLSTDSLGYLRYKGAANPTVFGSWRNSFYWKQWGLSFNIIYKLGYVFRRNSIFYYQVFTGASNGDPDYERRWRNPGDERRTNVPSLDYPADPNRDDFYRDAEVLVERGDHVRLQDLQLSYELSRAMHGKLPVSAIRFYLYANNLGILWKANHAGIDPDYLSAPPTPRTLALGIKVDY